MLRAAAMSHHLVQGSFDMSRTGFLMAADAAKYVHERSCKAVDGPGSSPKESVFLAKPASATGVSV